MLTYEDLLRFPDDGQRHELISGEHFVTACPSRAHQRLVGRLHVALFTFLEASTLGEVFLAPFDVVMSIHDVVEPDLLVVLDDQRDVLTKLNVRGAPALVVEVRSPFTGYRDEGLKRELYERAGVREYWLVDPDAPGVTRYARRPSADDFASPEVLTADDKLTSRLLPGFVLPLARLFREPL